MSLKRRGPAARHESGYVLILVLATLVLLALVVGRFANRVGQQREYSTTFRSEAEARIESDALLGELMRWIATHPLNASGSGDTKSGQVFMDGRWYELNGALQFSVQDQRGLVSINQLENPLLRRLLQVHGVPTDAVNRMLDVLADYIDPDSLRRLNGAERREYEDLGLEGPRNDYLRSPQELLGMPVWRDHATVVERLLPLLSPRLSGLLNPNTASDEVMQALLPGASPEQLSNFNILRRAGAFANGSRATATTGLPLDGDEYMFHVSNELRVLVWITGQPRAREYNLRLEPGGLSAPWLVTSSRNVARPTISNPSRPPFELSRTVIKSVDPRR